MNVPILWTFEKQGYAICFIAPEPCDRFFAGGGANTGLAIPDCPEGVGVTCRLDGDAPQLQCEGGARVATEDGDAMALTLSDGARAQVCDSAGRALFSVAVQYQPPRMAPAFDRAIELSMDRIRFGGSEACHVQFSQFGAADVAFELVRSGGSLQVCASPTPMGVYLNSRPLRPGVSTALEDGDFLFTADVAFAFRGGRLLTNHSVRIYDLPYADNAEQNSHLVYPKISRTTRFHEVVPTQAIDIQDPPVLPEPQQRNLLISLLPVGGMLLVTLLVRSRMSGGAMALFSVFSMGLGAVGSVFTYIETNKKYKADKQEREKLYRAYIDQRSGEIERLRQREREIMHRIYIDPDRQLRNVEEFTADLFDRSRDDDDFLDLRLGVGSVPSAQKIRCKGHEVFEKTDTLYELPQRLAERFALVDDMPVVVHSAKANAIGVQGNVESMGLMMNQMALDLCTRHYPSDVELYALCGTDFEPQMRAMRMLPHLQSINLGRRNIVHDAESRDLILEKLFKEFTVREEQKEYAATAPWLVIFVYADADLMQHPLMRYIPQASGLHALFVFWAQYREQLPIGCSYMVRLFTNTRSGVLVNMFDREADCMFAYRGVENRELERTAQKLAPVYSGETSLASELVRSLSFMDMPGIDRDASAEAILARWREADPRKTLAAPLGVTTGNKPVALDLVETAHGPHGLVAGTTGSGKSELLISYILSMACCYSPEDVNFVIIDFKGGGTASQFAGLPHLIGTITNLSDSEMNRSLVSIRAEHRRRQRLFNACGVSNINSYTTEYRAGRAKEPLPHLIIIADEFAELKAQQPEFMDELISTSRIGRSLGIHLILATQKPAGVVNEQIWSNSDFKLCLRVQSREDSNEMLRSPLAAEIREPGRAYLQVGRSGIFQLFQSGYSGVAAQTDPKAVRRFRIDMRSLSGRRSRLYEQAPAKDDKKARVRTQFDVVLDEVIRANERMGCARPRMLCQPPLPENLPFEYADDVSELYELPIGRFDQPSQQRQDTLTWDVLAGNLLVVGAAQMGKTNLLQTIVRSAASRMDALQIAFYIMDFNTGVFRTMESLDVVGSVVTQDQEERFKNLIKLLRQEIAQRKNLLVDANVTSFRAYLENGGNLNAIVVMLDNYAAYRELYDEEYGADITYLFREGPSVGISFAVTATRGILLGARNLSSFPQRILLHIADMNNMSEVIEGFRRKIPEQPGRGVCVIEKELLDVQIYNAFGGEEGEDERAAIEAFVAENSGGLSARAIPEVPALLTPQRLEEMFGAANDPFTFAYGMDYASVEPAVLALDTQFELTLEGKNTAGMRIFMNALMTHLSQPALAGRVEVYIVDHYDRGLSEWEGADCVALYTTDYAQSREILKSTLELAKARIEQVRAEGADSIEDLPLRVVIINTREAVTAISGDSAAMKAMEEMRDQYRLMKLLFVFGNLENKPVTFSAPGLLRQMKEARQALQFEPLSTGRMYEIDGMTARENRVTLTRDDAFRLDDGDVSHVKLVVTGTPEAAK